ncbi:MAG: hypothetical protein D6786_03495 [Gammaproteobacteria bacterium]|nr:MAG: hypothetical protein D6786_03495 [Gammaproteobacteria bacterium]
MELPAQLFPAPLLYTALGLYGLALLRALWQAPWWRLRDPVAQHAWLALTVVVLLLWQIRAQLPTGIAIHLLGATLLTLMFGRQFALLSLGLVLLVDCALGRADWAAFGLNGLLTGLLPVALSWHFGRLVANRLPRHFFVYIFLNAFLGGALAIAACTLAGAGLLGLAGGFGAGQLLHHHAGSLLLVFPEGFITGMLMTLFVVYAPGWVTTFRDEYYLAGK